MIMDYSILYTDNLILSFIGLFSIMFIAWAIHSSCNWKIILIMLIAFLGLIYYSADTLYGRTLNQHEDATAYLYKQAIEVYPDSSYAQKYYEMDSNKQAQINNLISNMDENRGKIGYYYGFATMTGTREASHLYGTSMYKMYGTPALIPLAIIVGLAISGAMVGRGVDSIKAYNNALKKENKNLKMENQKAKEEHNQLQEQLDEVRNRLTNKQEDLQRFEESERWKSVEDYQKRIKDYRSQIITALHTKQDYDNEIKQLQENIKQLKKEYKDLMTKKNEIDKEIADKEKTEKEAEKDAYNMLDAL